MGWSPQQKPGAIAGRLAVHKVTLELENPPVREPAGFIVSISMAGRVVDKAGAPALTDVFGQEVECEADYGSPERGDARS